ncbi:MAG TPA: prolipoprotein diacylglyceryl transferase [Gammaproteobacteria bacterium]|nr:prolipoprotein diacylglyceryl transferase [Gammaproteobacteria bacterium]
MLTYPDLNPVALSLGTWHLFGHVFQPSIHWYGITYLAGFLGCYLAAFVRVRKPGSGWTKEQLADLLFYVALGVVLGGRIGYTLFYAYDNQGHWLEWQNPLYLFQVWDGGMSFHGGLLGVLAALWLFARKYHKRYFEVADFTAVVVPIGLAAGRIGNFINGELWGKVSTLPWAMRIPCFNTRFTGSEYCRDAINGFSQPRQPTQLYEFLLEGVVLFVVLWVFTLKPRPRMAVSALFALLYGCFRFLVEFVRLPDPQFGYLAFGWLTMGQVLSLPLIILGGVVLVLAYRRKQGPGVA